jgi:phage terminase small subunit
MAPQRKRLRGSRMRPSDRAREAALTPGGEPPMPPRIADNPEARAEWTRLAAVLLDQQVLTRSHGDLLALFAETSALYARQLRDFALMHGQSVVVQTWADAQGRPHSRITLNPLVRALRYSQEMILRLAGEFGVSPASCGKVARVENLEDDPFEQFLRTAPAVIPFPTRRRRRKTGTDR